MSEPATVPHNDLFTDEEFSPLMFTEGRDCCDVCGHGIECGEARVISIEGVDGPEHRRRWWISCFGCAGESLLSDSELQYLADGWGRITRVLRDVRPAPTLPRVIPDQPMSGQEWRQIREWSV